MRWPKPPYKKPHPGYGDLRFKKRFAWTKTEVEGMIIWLEYYWSIEKYTESWGGTDYWRVTSKSLIDYV